MTSGPARQELLPALVDELSDAGEYESGPGEAEESEGIDSDEVGEVEDAEEAEGAEFGEQDEDSIAWPEYPTSEDGWSEDSAVLARGAQQDSVVIEVSADPDHQHTLTVFSHHLNNVLKIMGEEDWTGVGNGWATVLLGPSSLDSREEEPALTKLGKGCFKSLNRLKDKLDDVPRALDLREQYRFLVQEQRSLNRVMTNVNKAVTQMCNDIRASPDGSSRRSEISRRFRNELVDDVFTCVIPMLVLTLRSCFALGLAECDTEDGEVLPERGVFTRTTIQYMMWVTGWLLRLTTALTCESRDGRSEGGQPADRAQESEASNNNRKKFDVMLRKWKEQLVRPVEEFNRQVDMEQDRIAKKQRDLAIKEQKRREEEEDIARSIRQEEAFKASLRSILRKPRPLEEMWRKRESASVSSSGSSQLTGRASRESSAVAMSVEAEQPSLPSRSTSRPTPAASGAAVPRPGPALPPLILDYPPWPEDDTDWFLMQLRRPDRHARELEFCAEVLRRPLEEVRKEKERLKRLGQYQSP